MNQHLSRRTMAAMTSAAFLAAALAGCAADKLPEPPANNESGGAKASALTNVPTLNTFLDKSIEIDQLGASPPQDANLVTGNDSDGSASAQKPAGGPSSWVDWNDLGLDPTSMANHRFLDLDDPVAKGDTTSFPQSNECVATSQVLSKMDLTYVSVSNNMQYSYFGVQRSSNTGDAGYYWILTQKAPKLVQGEAPCSAGQKRLKYDISGPGVNGGTGDVMLAGHFKPNSAPLIRVFQAKASFNDVPATIALDFNNTAMWVEKPSAVGAAAVNTTVTRPGSFGSAGVKNMSGGNLGIELFAEAAVNLDIFTGASKCGATYYACVITRSSGSGGTSPDLKDVAGPSILNFGQTTATATLTPTCGSAFNYSASGKDMLGQPIANPSCSWTFSDGSTSNSCSGTINTLATGTVTGTVTVTNPASGCSGTSASASVLVYPSLVASASAAGTCASTVNYGSAVGGGSGSYSYAWTFTGAGTASPASSTSASGSFSVSSGGTPYTANLVVTDGRSDIVCKANASAVAVPYASVVASASLSPTCGLGFGYTASATQGGVALAGAQCTWSFDGGASASGSCSGSEAAGAGSHSGTVTITDPVSGCSANLTPASVNVYEPLGVSAVLVGNCTNGIEYAATVTGGSNPGGTGVAWTFSGPGAVTPAASTSLSGVAQVSVAAQSYTGNVVATDPRTDIQCTASASASATPYSPVVVSLSPSSGGGTCPGLSSDAITYTATVTGGDGSYNYLWSDGNCFGTSCTIAPPLGTLCYTQDVSVQVTDRSGVCGAATSETETYSKVTIVSASNN